jgi:hypothetical protein
MTCLQQLHIVHQTSRYQKLTDPFSEKAHLVIDFLTQLEKAESQTFNSWEEIQYFIKTHASFRQIFPISRFNKAQISTIIEGFVIIEKVEKVYHLTDERFEEVWRHIHPHAPIAPLYRYMVKCSSPTISIPIFIQYRSYFEANEFSTEQYLCCLNSWLMTYTQHQWNQIISGVDNIYSSTAQTIVHHFTHHDIELWLQLTITQFYEDALAETYFYWIRTVILQEICKTSAFRLSLTAFEQMLEAAIHTMDISSAEALKCLKEVFYLDELTQIILWHPHFSALADKVLLYRRIQNCIFAGETLCHLQQH